LCGRNSTVAAEQEIEERPCYESGRPLMFPT
jgi:hypothetical protein